MAIPVLTSLLANNECLCDAHDSSASTAPDAPPLPPTCVEGLLAALYWRHCTSQPVLYGESLSYRLTPETAPIG